MKKFVIFIFFLTGFLINPVPALADIICDDNGATINSLVNFNNILEITITTTSASHDYNLLCLEEADYLFPGSCITMNASQVVCTITVSEFNSTNCAANPGKVWFGLEYNSSDDCSFYLKGTDIVAALTAAGVPPAAGVGVTAPPPAAGGGGAAGGGAPIAVPGLPGCVGIETGLGPIPTDPECLVKWILKYAILMGGGIAFLLSVFGGVSIILAGGNPEKINSGKEIIGSALTGLLFIIFSVFLLRFIGLDILQLPGFK